jgi:hypothetical protein
MLNVSRDKQCKGMSMVLKQSTLTLSSAALSKSQVLPTKLLAQY